ncbi:MAG: S8 family serine peptidase [Flavobacteriales bacterium]|nr:S8 family serine peptidase [Flavobacteriales bacterium]
MKNLKISAFLMLWLGFYSLSVAQTESKYGFILREYLKTVTPNSQVPLLIEGDPESMSSIVDRYEGQIRLQVNNLFSLEIPAKHVDSFSKEAAVSLIEFSITPGRTLSDTMLLHTNVDSIIQQALPLRTQYTGKGVLLGVIDSGVELAHPDFKDSTGRTRVLYVWDQRQAFNPARQALQYNYGVEWDSSAINSGVSTHDDGAAEFGHGSNVTGAAASNGLASGQFRGVAAEVNIISVATDFNKPNWLQTVAESVDYIYKKADALGMPCVINASVGTYVGSHDGKDISARIIDALIQQKAGRAFVCAAGNAGNQKFHVQQKPINDTAFTWFEYAPAQWSGLGGYYYEVWSDTANFKNLQFSIGTDKESNGVYTFKGRTAFSGINNRLNIIYNDTIRDNSGHLIATVSTYAEQNQGRYKLEIAIEDPDSSDFLYRFETKGTGKIDIYSSFSLFRHNNIINTSLPSVIQYPAMANYIRQIACKQR